MKPALQHYIERREKFLKVLELYYLDQRDLTHISRTLGISSSTVHRWFNQWCLGKMFQDIPKPKLSTEDIVKISKARYL